MNNIDFNRNIRNIIALLHFKGVGRQKIKILFQVINQPQQLSFKEIVAAGQTFQIISVDISLAAQNAAIEHADKVMQSSEKFGIKWVSFLDDHFPKSFDFYDSPVMLYYQGNLDLLNHKKRAAVVGSRNPTASGAAFAYEAAKFLAQKDFAVISGLATGCDYYGHTGCLEAGGGTVAFLPSGLLNIYPVENRPLAKKILENNGCLLSEYTCFETVLPYKFIERDRLQSGSSLFVVVSNFSSGSGTIHTLNFSKKYKKKIYSIPIIYAESQNGFTELEQRKIPFEILEQDELLDLIENFNK